MSKFFDFAYFGDMSNKLDFLANLTKENWDSSKGKNSILIYYLDHTFDRLQEENKIVIEDTYTLFNTGLFTHLYAPIYCFLTPNRNCTENRKQIWYLDGFYTEYDLGKRGISNFPERANYFTNPDLLVFNANLPINIQFDHIMTDEENISRFPPELQDDEMLVSRFSGAVEIMKKKVTANYKLAVPQCYNNTIQLLLPLCLTSKDKADLALVVTNCGTFYQGHTCLSVEMAYSNARLIAKPESDWLKI